MTRAFDGERKPPKAIVPLVEFLFRPRSQNKKTLSAASLFSGAGLSDIGYEQAGFQFLLQSELDANRAALCAENFPQSQIIPGAVAEQKEIIIRECQRNSPKRIALLSITPPCQGMSSSNPGRGKVSDPEVRDERNRLLLDAIPIIKALQPRFVVAENVMQVLKETVEIRGKRKKIIEAFESALKDYRLFTGVVQMADFGIPQMRKRAIVVCIRKDENCLSELLSNQVKPWPHPTHAENPTNGQLPWVALQMWLEFMNYPLLDAKSESSASSDGDALHFVPNYEDNRYFWVADIPPYSGQNAYQNCNCRACGNLYVPEGLPYCNRCDAPMINRPHVEENGTFRLIKGFNSSYRRMFPNRPAPTVMTNSSHLGSDYKIHPWENRVLSIRECAELQTIPRFYKWDWAIRTQHTYIARQVIGEALPSWFTYLHGKVLCNLLEGKVNPEELAEE